MRKILAIAALLPLMAACATYPTAAQVLTPQQTSVLKATCSQVMRLKEGQAQFDGCVSSLSETFANQILASQAGQAYRDCDQSVAKRGTPDFSRCVLDRENAQPTATRATPQLDESYVKPVNNDQESYFHTNFDQRRRREQYSCAALGLQPSSGSFTGCVNDLDMTLFELDHPLN